MDHLNVRVNYNAANYSSLIFTKKDEAILKELAKTVAEIASRPIMAEKTKLWVAHNKLQKTRPLILCDPENGWNEIIPESRLQCENDIARHWECHLRKQIFWGDVMGDDYVVEPVFNLPYVYKNTGWNIGGKTTLAAKGPDATDDGKAYHIDAIMEDYAQLSLIEKDEYVLDYAKTNTLLETAHKLFDGILNVRLNTVWFWSFGLTDDAAFLRGMETLMYDFYDEPEEVHKLMQVLFDGTMQKLDFLEKEKLLCLNNDAHFVGSGGLGITDELPAKDFSGTVRTSDMWGLGESQITVGVSPDMFKEFIFPYHKRLMERFGLTCYGCCEPMDDRIDLVRGIKNLRRVSVSAWANREIMSQKLAHNYIYSLKPTPTDLAVPLMDEAHVRKGLKEHFAIAKNNCLELIMKDNHTLGGNPNNLLNWARIAKEEIENM